MKPEQFIREYGVEKAREVVAASANALVQCSDGTTFHVNDLKRLVESLETIESWGGIENCKELVRRATSNQEPPEKSFARKLQMDVANHESIYGGGENA